MTDQKTIHVEFISCKTVYKYVNGVLVPAPDPPDPPKPFNPAAFVVLDKTHVKVSDDTRP